MENPVTTAPFRSLHRQALDGPLCIEVIGYHQELEPVYQAQGMRDWFVYVFPADCIYRATDGIHHSTQPGIFFQAPHSIIEHRAPTDLLFRSWMRFHLADFHSQLQEYGLQANHYYAVESLTDHEAFLLALHRELQHPLGAQSQICMHILQHWLMHLAREQGLLQKQPAAIPAAVSRARDFINQHFLSDIGLNDIVAASGISRTHLCRAFKKHIQSSPMHYALLLRLEYAKDLLLNPQHRLQDVAEQAGFTDEYYFNRCFKREVGISPGAWRLEPHPPEE